MSYAIFILNRNSVKLTLLAIVKLLYRFICSPQRQDVSDFLFRSSSMYRDLIFNLVMSHDVISGMALKYRYCEMTIPLTRKSQHDLTYRKTRGILSPISGIPVTVFRNRSGF